MENEELNMELAYMAMMYRTNPKQLVKVLRETGQLQSVYTNVLHRKARNLIIQNSNAAEVEEKATDEEQKPSAEVEQNLFEETAKE